MRKLCIIIACISAFQLFSQQDPQYTQYMYNLSVINPAYAGSTENPSFGLLYRNQWTGIDGAPQTGTFFGHTALKNKLGIGASVIADQLGPVKETNVYADISYTLKFESNHRLAFGLKVGATFHDIGLNNLTVFDANDPFFSENINSTTPNLGVGVFYYSENYYAGISVPNLIDAVHLNTNGVRLGSETQHYFITAGYVFNLSENTKLKPSFLVKSAFNAPTSFDVNTNVLLYNKLELGASYRYDDSFSGLVNVYINPNLRIGYAYDAVTSNLRQFASASHEVFILLQLPSKEKDRRIKSPRFF
ncbi:PorP/SprF family type IX secretion system membrane protein [Winogradskyella immobilis]|uniref:Type IX secretion system membrane protein PorP/SprF n=1 Tax=Winogradskyella immobilis TaxID=2816852 RepID=A0ABS8EKH1_9FLAO|nr:type IX secretion system membrane protein PorP/SprF [Winogradskyella immobilis]MCC1483337.1 type IX secretion system membrane protein PorP/SprF [Winogradskyella immobilis]MCG0015431.1 type IX secretion system membrane protein PorP/SprF [Winogradskyella immobilis]